MTNAKMVEATRLVREISERAERLSELFKRPFTPDGHMVGSIGEVWAAWMFDLELLTASTETHDAKTKNGALVQIKATQGTAIAISSEPKYLVVHRLNRDGSPPDVIFNGPGRTAWALRGKKSKTGQHRISLSSLKRVMKLVPASKQLTRAR